MKKEYRGTRNKEAITDYIRKLMSDPVVHIVFNTYDDMNAIHYNKSAVIGYFKESPEKHPKYSAFRRVATDLQGYCHFYWVTNSPFLTDERQEMLAFKSYRSSSQSEYDFVYQTYDELSTWSTYLCIPIVREITFDNAEEIIEEGLPLVILFHKSDDEHSLEMFKSIIQKELVNQTSYVNFVTADGTAFSHPLSHMDKSEKDLPLIALDSFEHMYLFPKFEDLKSVNDCLKEYSIIDFVFQ